MCSSVSGSVVVYRSVFMLHEGMCGMMFVFFCIVVVFFFASCACVGV